MNKNVQDMNKLVKILQEQINKKWTQIEQTNLKRQDENISNYEKLEITNITQQELIKKLQAENKKLETKIEKIEENSKMTAAMIESQIDKILDKKIHLIQKQQPAVKEVKTVGQTKSTTTSTQPRTTSVQPRATLRKEENVSAVTIQKKEAKIEKQPKIIEKEQIEEIEENIVPRKRRTNGTTQILGFFDTDQDVY